MKLSTTQKGILLSVITAFISGVSIFYNKSVIVRGVDPLVFNVVKNGGVAIILSLFLTRRMLRRKSFTGSSVPWKKLFVIGAIGGSIPFLMFFTGLKDTPAVTANFLNKTVFIWVAILAFPFLKERLNVLQLAAYFAVSLGTVFLAGPITLHGTASELLISGAVLFWGIEYILVKKIFPDVHPLTAAWGRMFFGTLILFILTVMTGKIISLSSLTAIQIFPILGSVILLTAYVSCLYISLSLAPATLVSALLVLATPVTATLTFLSTGKSLPQTELIGGFLTLLGVATITKIAIRNRYTSLPTT
jgi:drug/metabolite transporter (DMT)-like permease